MFNKKGQAALEFLTTYGWAFLVVLVMIGALSYFGVLNPENYIPDSCNFGTVLSCSGGYGMSYNGNAPAESVIEIDVINMMSESFNLSNIKIKEKNDPYYTDVTGDTTIDGNSAIGVLLNPQDGGLLKIVPTDGDYLRSNVGRKKVYMFKIEYFKAGSTIISSVDGTVTTQIREI